MKAMNAAMLVQAYAQRHFPDDALGMETVCVMNFLYTADYVDTGSHKYIPAERLTQQIGAKPGCGVYNYVKFDDGSYLLLTCNQGVCAWDGTDNAPRFPKRD